MDHEVYSSQQIMRGLENLNIKKVSAVIGVPYRTMLRAGKSGQVDLRTAEIITRYLDVWESI